MNLHCWWLEMWLHYLVSDVDVWLHCVKKWICKMMTEIFFRMPIIHAIPCMHFNVSSVVLEMDQKLLFDSSIWGMFKPQLGKKSRPVLFCLKFMSVIFIMVYFHPVSFFFFSSPNLSEFARWWQRYFLECRMEWCLEYDRGLNTLAA